MWLAMVAFPAHRAGRIVDTAKCVPTVSLMTTSGSVGWAARIHPRLEVCVCPLAYMCRSRVGCVLSRGRPASPQRPHKSSGQHTLPAFTLPHDQGTRHFYRLPTRAGCVMADYQAADAAKLSYELTHMAGFSAGSRVALAGRSHPVAHRG